MEKLNCRKATASDLMCYFNWANDPLVRTNAIHSNRIPLEDHIDWFNKKLLDQKVFMYIFEQQEAPIGQVRFDLQKEDAIIDYSIDIAFRGKGLGRKILNKAIEELTRKDQLSLKKITGWVKEENIPSIRTFEKLGFQLTSQTKLKGHSYNIFTKNNENNYRKL